MENLSGDAKFLFIAMMKSALLFRELGQDKEKFIMFAGEIWESMLLSDPNELHNTLQSTMQKDVQNYMKNYKDVL